MRTRPEISPWVFIPFGAIYVGSAESIWRGPISAAYIPLTYQFSAILSMPSLWPATKHGRRWQIVVQLTIRLLRLCYLERPELNEPYRIGSITHSMTGHP